MFSQLLQRYGNVLMFGILLLAGLSVFQDFGLAWDEPQQRIIGQKSFEYVFFNSNELKAFHDRTYGVAFELPLIAAERILGLTDTRAIYTMRHLLTHFFFLLSAFFFFKLCLRIFKRSWLALAGVVLLVTFPRIYAHSFFNSKDLPFLSMFIICCYTMENCWRKRTLRAWVLHGVMVGLLMNLRLMGILIISMSFLPDLWLLFKMHRIRSVIYQRSLFLITALVVLILTWPFLWYDPVNGLFEAFERMSDFEWNYTVLFLGEDISARDLPWYYTPVWMLVTIPIHVLLLILFGASSTILMFNGIRREPSVSHLLIIGSILMLSGSLIMVAVLGSTLYDGWRQLYFLYPLCVLIALFGLEKVAERTSVHKRSYVPIACVLIMYQAWTVFRMVRSHPNQQVLFNELTYLTSNGMSEYFELDYWGVSYRSALEFIARKDQGKQLEYLAANDPGCLNLQLLAPSIREVMVCSEEHNPSAKYYVTNYRWEREGPEQGELIWVNRVERDTICGVYLLP